MLRTITIALATAFSSLLAQPADQALQRKNALQLWLATTVQHSPGAADDAAALAARWTAADFERLLPSLIYYLDMVRAQETRTRTSCSACKVSSDERKWLRDETQSQISTTEEKLIRDLPRPDRLNDLILRGATLRDLFETTHDVEHPQGPEEIMSSADGQYVGSVTGAPHWYLARALLQFITPEPALHDDTRRHWTRLRRTA